MDFKQRWPLENGRYVFDHIETLSGRSLRCSQCQEQDIKYVHHLRDLTTGEKIRVGCECAGRLLGDVAGARRRQLKHMRDDRPQKQKASVPGSKTHGRTSRSSPTERNARTRVCPGAQSISTFRVPSASRSRKAPITKSRSRSLRSCV